MSNIISTQRKSFRYSKQNKGVFHVYGVNYFTIYITVDKYVAVRHYQQMFKEVIYFNIKKKTYLASLRNMISFGVQIFGVD